MHKTKPIMKVIFIPIIVFFLLFLIAPILAMIWGSLKTETNISFQHYIEALQSSQIQQSMINSLQVSSIAAFSTTSLAFLLAYAVHMTKIPQSLKRFVKTVVVFPMLLPTITYGFVLIYVFGNQGLMTKLFIWSSMEIYGFNGLLIGYVLYTLPAAFLLLQNGFQYVDQRFLLVSVMMGDNSLRRLYHAVLRPLIGSLGGAFVLSFILSFTDFGIPASIGGSYEVISTTLYQTMLGSIPDFEQGAVIAVFMLVPALIGVFILKMLDQLNVEYRFSGVDGVLKNKWKDWTFGLFSSVVAFSIIAIFMIMFIAPFSVSYPYDLSFTTAHLTEALTGNDLMRVFWNSLVVAGLTAAVGTLFTFSAALLSTRTALRFKRSLDWVAMVTNTIPGMVLGLSYLFLFNNSSLKGTFMIIILCNLVHFFTTPYLMAKNALMKMEGTWEVTGELLKDSWIQTVYRVIVPNAHKTLIEMFSYYFVNAMVTVSGVIFLVTTETNLVSTKIKELQHFNQFNEIFILSILIFAANMVVKLGCDFLVQDRPLKKEAQKDNEQIQDSQFHIVN